jgi:hypothetical protein
VPDCVRFEDENGGCLGPPLGWEPGAAVRTLRLAGEQTSAGAGAMPANNLSLVLKKPV